MIGVLTSNLHRDQSEKSVKHHIHACPELILVEKLIVPAIRTVWLDRAGKDFRKRIPLETGEKLQRKRKIFQLKIGRMGID
jgi:hypothetical protein